MRGWQPPGGGPLPRRASAMSASIRLETVMLGCQQSTVLGPYRTDMQTYQPMQDGHHQRGGTRTAPSSSAILSFTSKRVPPLDSTINSIIIIIKTAGYLPKAKREVTRDQTGGHGTQTGDRGRPNGRSREIKREITGEQTGGHGRSREDKISSLTLSHSLSLSLTLTLSHTLSHSFLINSWKNPCEMFAVVFKFTVL